MGLTYFKRYRLEIPLTGTLFDCPRLPPEYSFVAWHRSLLESHAETKYRSFCCEIDANVFPCLGERDGCRRLMDEIARRDSFVEQATWLLAYQPPGHATPEYCGTIQGLRDRHGLRGRAKSRRHAAAPFSRTGHGTAPPVPVRISHGRAAACLPGGDSPEHRCDPSLPGTWISPGEDRLQGCRGCVRVAGAVISTVLTP